jgi:hypothetical protein
MYHSVSEEQIIQGVHFVVSQITAALSHPPGAYYDSNLVRETIKFGSELRKGPDQLCGCPVFLFIGYRSKNNRNEMLVTYCHLSLMF